MPRNHDKLPLPIAGGSSLGVCVIFFLQQGAGQMSLSTMAINTGLVKALFTTFVKEKKKSRFLHLLNISIFLNMIFQGVLQHPQDPYFLRQGHIMQYSWPGPIKKTVWHLGYNLWVVKSLEIISASIEGYRHYEEITDISLLCRDPENIYFSHVTQR